MERQEAGRGNVAQKDGILHISRSVSASFIYFGLVILVIQITACAVVLARSEHEMPNAPLRAYIIGNLYGCVTCVDLLVLDYICQRQIWNLMAAHNIYFKIQIASYVVKALMSFFFIGWFIAGCVWVAKANSTSTDAPQLFWLSMAFVILNASGFALGFIVLLFMCCCIPCIMACFR